MIPETDQIFTEVELSTLEKVINETVVSKGVGEPVQDVFLDVFNATANGFTLTWGQGAV